MNLSQLRPLLPHGLAILGCLILLMIFFGPSFFSSKVLDQHDIKMHQGASKQLADYRAETGEEGLWAESLFSGMPGYLISMKFNWDLPNWIVMNIINSIPGPAHFVFWAFLGYYLMLITYGARPLIAFGFAIVFAFCTYNIISISAGHTSKTLAGALIPWLFMGLNVAFRRKAIWGALICCLVLAIQLRVNHLQITYYTLIAVVFYGVNELYWAWKKNGLAPFLQTSGLLIAGVIVAVAMNFGRLWTTYEYGQHSIRGKSELTQQESTSGLDKAYAFEFSNGIFEPFFLMIPNVMGGPSSMEVDEKGALGKALRAQGLGRQQIRQQLQNVPTYWGEQRMTAPYYAGAVAIFFFVFGLIVLPKDKKIWLGLLALFAILVSMGKNLAWFNYFLFDYVPGFNKFRSVTFIIVLAAFSFPFLGALALEELLRNPGLKRKFLYAAGGVVGFCILLMMVSGTFSYTGAIDSRLNLPNWYQAALLEQRQSLLIGDTLRAMVLVLLSFGAVWLVLLEKIKPLIGIAAIAAILSFDMLNVSGRFFGEENYVQGKKAEPFQPSAADRQIMQDQNYYRVLNLINPFNDGQTSFFHNSVGGYHGAKMRTYQDLIERGVSPEHQELVSLLQAGSRNYGDLGVLNMLNTRYFKFGDQANQVVSNPFANGNAWFVTSVEVVATADEEIERTTQIDTKTQALIRNYTGPSEYSNGSIELVSHLPNELVYQSTNSGSGLAVFSEVYYPIGWTAYIDDVETEIKRANYVLRALEVPAGNHEIRFVFKPRSYLTGGNIMVAANSIFLLLLGASLFLTRKELLGSANEQ